jgi:fructokinase
MPVKPVVVGLGEVLWDCFDDTRRAGGAPANVAFHAAQLGAVGLVCSRVGEDDLGAELLDFLARHGLSVETIQRDAHHATGTVTVHSGAQAGPSYTIHQDVAWDFLEMTPQWRETCSRAAAVCFGTLAQRSPQSRATIHACLQASAGALLVYDVNLRPPFIERSWIEASLGRCHVAKLNADEHEVLADLLGLKASGQAAFACALIERYGLQAACITRGADGCLIATVDEVVEAPGVEVTVVDTVGAGDAFTAALTLGWLRHWPLGNVAAFANEVGALVAARPGAMPPLATAFAGVVERLAP